VNVSEWDGILGSEALCEMCDLVFLCVWGPFVGIPRPASRWPICQADYRGSGRSKVPFLRLLACPWREIRRVHQTKVDADVCCSQGDSIEAVRSVKVSHNKCCCLSIAALPVARQWIMIWLCCMADLRVRPCHCDSYIQPLWSKDQYRVILNGALWGSICYELTLLYMLTALDLVCI